MKNNARLKYMKFRLMEFLKKDLLGALIVFFALILIAVSFLASPPEIKGQYVGKIVGLHQLQSEVPEPPKLVTELEDGQRVILEGSQGVLRKIGSNVIVELRGRRYHFVEISDE